MHRREVDINGTPLSFETGKLAKQATARCWCAWAIRVVLVTACAAANPREGIIFSR